MRDTEKCFLQFGSWKPAKSSETLGHVRASGGHGGREEGGRLSRGDREVSHHPSSTPDVPALFPAPLLCPLDHTQRHAHTHAQVQTDVLSTSKLNKK